MVLALGNGVAWTIYGALRHDPAIMVCNTLLASSTLAILLRWAADRRPTTVAVEPEESMVPESVLIP